MFSLFSFAFLLSFIQVVFFLEKMAEKCLTHKYEDLMEGVAVVSTADGKIEKRVCGICLSNLKNLGYMVEVQPVGSTSHTVRTAEKYD